MDIVLYFINIASKAAEAHNNRGIGWSLSPSQNALKLVKLVATVKEVDRNEEFIVAYLLNDVVRKTPS